jgi:hypothetical protein
VIRASDQYHAVELLVVRERSGAPVESVATGNEGIRTRWLQWLLSEPQAVSPRDNAIDAALERLYDEIDGRAAESETRLIDESNEILQESELKRLRQIIPMRS